MDIPVNLRDIPEIESVPEGKYLCRVDKIEMRDSKNTPGNKNLHVEYIVTGGSEFDGRRLFDELSLSMKALWRVRDFVEACGIFPGPDGFKTEEVMGAHLYVGVIMEARQTRDALGQLVVVPGKFRNKVVGYEKATA
jgi:hypothetical protein